MDNENNETQSDPKQKYWLIYVLLASIFIFGIFSVFKSKSEKEQAVSVNESQQSPTEQSTINGLDESNIQTIQIEGGMTYFKPNEIKVKLGETVKIEFINVEGLHDFVVDELNIKTKIIGSGKTETVEFTPDKIGSFEFYCSVANHRQQGMVGTLIVEE